LGGTEATQVEAGKMSSAVPEEYGTGSGSDRVNLSQEVRRVKTELLSCDFVDRIAARLKKRTIHEITRNLTN
jgi:hypothetical protein